MVKEKMENKGTILSYRPDIRVVDATIRDGGLVNDFRFTDEFVKNLYQANIKAGVDYMEFGYKASKDIFEEARVQQESVPKVPVKADGPSG